MLDLSTLAVSAEEGADLTLLHPDTNEALMQDNGEPVTIRLAGSDSDRYQRMQRANLNRRFKTARGQRGGANISAEEWDAERLEILVACTLSWSGIVLDGEVLECNAANARRLYTHKRVPWVREQADDFINDRRNFLTASSKS